MAEYTVINTDCQAPPLEAGPPGWLRSSYPEKTNSLAPRPSQAGRSLPGPTIEPATAPAYSWAPWQRYPWLPLGPEYDLTNQLHSIILSMEQSVNFRPVRRGLSGLLRENASSCESKYRKVLCGCGWSIVRAGCMAYDCPECGPKIKRRRANKTKARLFAGRHGRPIIYTVFTVPPEARELLADRKEWRKRVRAAWAVLKADFGGEFGLESSHPYGEKQEGDYDPALFHPHANFLWVQRAGQSAYIDVARLRAAWAKILKLPAGREPVIWSRYFKARGEEKDLQDRISYICRTFPGFSTWVGSIRWYGKYPKKIKAFVPVCPVCGEPYLNAGKADKADYLAFLAIQQHQPRGQPCVN